MEYADSQRFSIKRYYYDEKKRTRTIATGLTLEEAREHCSREDTHKVDKTGHVVWFDGFIQE